MAINNMVANIDEYYNLSNVSRERVAHTGELLGNAKHFSLIFTFHNAASSKSFLINFL